jgi:hypothetical protein
MGSTLEFAKRKSFQLVFGFPPARIDEIRDLNRASVFLPTDETANYYVPEVIKPARVNGKWLTA